MSASSTATILVVNREGQTVAGVLVSLSRSILDIKNGESGTFSDRFAGSIVAVRHLPEIDGHENDVKADVTYRVCAHCGAPFPVVGDMECVKCRVSPIYSAKYADFLAIPNSVERFLRDLKSYPDIFSIDPGIVRQEQRNVLATQGMHTSHRDQVLLAS